MIGLNEKIFKHWVHSHEEEEEDVRVYRPSNYKFPLSRGREGFEIKSNGEFISYDIAPADGTDIVNGGWEEEGPNNLKVSFPGKLKKLRTLNIVSCEDNVLKVKK